MQFQSALSTDPIGIGFIQNLNNSKNIGLAELHYDDLDIGTITLREDYKFVAIYGHTDWSCSDSGGYSISSDTLYFSNDLFVLSNGILANQYYIADAVLIPILEPSNTLPYFGETEKLLISYWP